MRQQSAIAVASPSGLEWGALPWQAQLYVSAVLLGGAVLLADTFPLSFPQPLLFGVLVALACVTSLWKVNLPLGAASGATLSVSYAANLMALLLLGPERSILVAAAGVWAQCTFKVKRHYPLYRTLFSIAAEIITMAATSAVYLWLDGPLAPTRALGLAKPLVGAIATYFFVNTGLVAAAISLSSHRRFFSVWQGDFFWSAASFMVAGSAGAMAAVIVARGSQWRAILLIAPIYLTYRTYQLFVGRLEDDRRHMAEMRQVHEGTVKALMQAREAEVAEQEARAAAERANRLKDEFLAIVSHELRTPLNSILGWADMLRKQRLDEAKGHRAFQSIYDSAQRQAKLIDDLLDVSRVMSGTLRLERTAVDMRDVVDEALEVVQPAADAKGVRLSGNSSACSGFIQGDNARLQQIVCNLLSNAIKFTPPGGSVHISAVRVRNAIEIEVRDTGQGIPASFLPHVFEPFRQADGTTTRVHGGLGLGLSIVQHLVKAHDGTVSAQSTGPGQGATFTVRFPIDPACADVVPPALPPRLPERFEPLSLNGLHILVVDDDEESRLVVAEHLKGSGAMVLAAASAADAYDVLRREHVDGVLADIAMPGEDGYAFIRRIRAGVLPDSARIPAVALTALTRKEDRQQALDAGFQMHLPKPVDPDALVAALAVLTQPSTVAPRRPMGAA